MLSRVLYLLACIPISTFAAETVIVPATPSGTTEQVIVQPGTPAATTEQVTVTPVAPAGTTQEVIVTKPTSISTTKKMIVTEVPSPKEVIETPTGFVNCFTVAAGWYKNEWIPAHNICQYENMPGKAAWVEGYWSCTQYKIEEGICTDWKWRKGHWSNMLTVY